MFSDFASKASKAGTFLESLFNLASMTSSILSNFSICLALSYSSPSWKVSLKWSMKFYVEGEGMWGKTYVELVTETWSLDHCHGGNSWAANILLEEQVGVQKNGSTEYCCNSQALLGEFAFVGNQDLTILGVV